jgi:hypothetical protein
MNATVIIDRIRERLAAGGLTAMPAPAASVAPLTTIGDMLRPWSEVYPNTEETEEIETYNLFENGSLTKVTFRPSPRMSLRPMPAPRKIAGNAKLIRPGLFAAVRAIWDWYGTRNSANPALLAEPITERGFLSFIEEFRDEAEGWGWPVCCPLDQLFEECSSVTSLPGVCLSLPFWHYEEDGVGIIDGFLSGTDGIEWVMRYTQDRFEAFSAKDKALVDKIGYARLAMAYAQFKGKKTYDIVKLENFGDTFFGPVKEKFPEQMKTDWPVITDDYEAALVRITRREDIEFCFAYVNAYYDMRDAMPDPYDFEQNAGGIAEQFAHELCEVWRKTRKKPAAEEPARPNPLTEVLQ